MKKFANEFKVGLFVILCLIGLFYLVLSTGKLNVSRPGYYINVVFNDVAGLQKKAPVMLNGLEVGKVEDINVSYDNDKTQVVLKLWFERSAKVRENPIVSIKTLGLMGEKFIQISSSEGKEFIKPGATLQGKPFLDLDVLMEQAQSMTKEIGEQVNKLVASLNTTLDDNQESVSGIIQNLEGTSKNFEEFSSDIKAHPWKLLWKSQDKSKQKK